MARLDGRVALVSGSARGMGEAIVRALVAEGAKAIISDVLDDEGKALAAELGDDAIYVHLDVTKEADWIAAVAVGKEAFGKVDVLVNNAGILTFGAVDEHSYEDWDRTIAINLTGFFKGIREVSPAITEAGGGAIVNISSAAGFVAYPMLPAYTAAKWGVRGLTKSAALDLAKYGIRVNSVHPGVIETAMTAGQGIPTAHVAMDRYGQTSEIAALVVFLVSDDASFSTGAEFLADGGEIAGRAMNPG